jgi:hypothetical protein
VAQCFHDGIDTVSFTLYSAPTGTDAMHQLWVVLNGARPIEDSTERFHLQASGAAMRVPQRVYPLEIRDISGGAFRRGITVGISIPQDTRQLTLEFFGINGVLVGQEVLDRPSAGITEAPIRASLPPGAVAILRLTCRHDSGKTEVLAAKAVFPW